MLNLSMFSHNHHLSRVKMVAKFIRRGIRVITVDCLTSFGTWTVSIRGTMLYEYNQTISLMDEIKAQAQALIRALQAGACFPGSPNQKWNAVSDIWTSLRLEGDLEFELLSYHYISGAKPTYVYLASLGLGSTGLYPSVIDGLELAGFHTLMPDFLGCGYSEQPEAFGYTVDEYVDSLAFFLDKVGASQCSIIGHSSGGAVAIALATKRPDLVARLALAEGDLDASDWFDCASQSEEQYIASGRRIYLEQFSQNLPYFEESDRSWWPMLKKAIPSSAFYRTAHSLSQSTHPTWREQLYLLDIPRLYLFGDLSLQRKSMPDQEQEILVARDVQVAVIPRAWHNMMLDNPNAFAHAIVEFEKG